MNREKKYKKSIFFLVKHMYFVIDHKNLFLYSLVLSMFNYFFQSFEFVPRAPLIGLL